MTLDPQANDTGLVAAVKTCLRKYADFSGRASRSEYWFWALAVFVSFVGLLTISFVLNALASPLGTYFELLGVVSILFGGLLPGLAVSVRRLHDTDKPGVYYLFSLVPCVGPFIVLVFALMEGTPGLNRYGPVPGPLTGPAALARAPSLVPQGFGMTLERVPADSGNVVVVDVLAGGPAAQAGVPIGAVLNALDGIPVRDPNDAPTLLATKGLGDFTVITVTLRGERQNLLCQHGKLPAKPYGFTLGPGTRPQGVTVLEVSPDGLARHAGLTPGCDLVTIDGHVVSDPHEVASILASKRQGDSSTLGFLAADQNYEVTVEH
jgi:uncharacterized membrane protein YhaH (DUF805 family)